ncbi:DUF1482 family protein [Escherichia coli]|uniref:DUF1482 family protein n=1 Tax=Escherichia coli TaxID=562 RepID=UPI000B3F26F6|nr:DUF1482 family protein [Escherichia coli]OVC86366.1 hypothetical protein UQ09_25610 [Escherichia coli]
MLVFIVPAESQNVSTEIYASKESCRQARGEQKISGECLPGKKVSLYLNDETPAG